MFETFEHARQAVLEKGIEVIDLKFCDLWGRWHHLTIPASQFGPKLMEADTHEIIANDPRNIVIRTLMCRVLRVERCMQCPIRKI